MQKSILITGCSSGIGLYAATALQQRGYRVFATARHASDVAALQAQGLESLLLDVNNTHSMQQAFTEILHRTGGTLFALFNNAGYLQSGAIEDLSRDVMRAQFETNVFGAMELTNMVIPIMRKQGYGRIIQNTSILGVMTIPYCGVYSAAKFALEGFSNTLRQELYSSPIKVCIMAPGPIMSKLREHAYQHYQQSLKQQTKTSAHAEKYRQLENNYFNSGKSQSFMASPEILLTKLIHALESPHPKAHYFVGLPAQLFAFLRRILPDSMLDWVVRKAW